MKWYGLLLTSDWDCTHVSHTLVRVAKMWTPEVYTAYLADEVPLGNSAI